jgi:hypothetical protein
MTLIGTCRYLAVRARLSLAPEVSASPSGLRLGGGGSGGGCSMRQSLVVQPESLAGHVLYSTPLGAKSMRLAGRGALADEGTVYTSKVRTI